jgi:hypothetical protein
MSSSDKCKHKTLSAKTEIIKKLDKGKTPINLSKESGVGRAMTYDITKSREIKINLFRLFPVIRLFR